MNVDRAEKSVFMDERIQQFLQNERMKQKILAIGTNGASEEEQSNWDTYELENVRIKIPPCFNEMKLDKEETIFGTGLCFYCENTYMFMHSKNNIHFGMEMANAKKRLKVENPRIVFLSEKHAENVDNMHDYLFCKQKKRREYLWYAYGIAYTDYEGISLDLISPFHNRKKFEQLVVKILENVKLIKEKSQ